MVSPPQAGLGLQSLDYSYRYQQQESAELSVVHKNPEGEQAVRVSASYSSTVTISGQSRGQHSFASSGVEKYQAVSEQAPKTQATNNILSFVALRLEQDAAEGATQEELASRLQAGYEGFMQGYGEAYDELSAAGLLSPEAEDAITQTYNAVLEGINGLAEKYGVESPVTKDVDGTATAPVGDVTALAPTTQVMSSAPQPIDVGNTMAAFAENLVDSTEGLSTLLEATTIDYERLAKNDFSFQLKTQDGDTVTIRASSSFGEKAGLAAVDYSGPYGDYQAGRLQYEQSQSSSFQFNVEGELDEDELSAINDLLNQVGDLSESFFSGNIEEAFAMALDIGFDESEIARFSLNLKQEVTTKVESAYASVGPQAPATDSREGQFQHAEHNSSIARLKVFVQMLNEVTKQTESLGFERKAIVDITEQLTQAQNSDQGKHDKLQNFLGKMLYELPEA